MVGLGYCSSDTSIALSLSTERFQALMQRGFEGWPIHSTASFFEHSSSAQVVMQVVLGISPELDQPVNLEFFLSDTVCFTSFGGAIIYVSVKATDTAVSNLFVRGKNVVSYTRELVSSKTSAGIY